MLAKIKKKLGFFSSDQDSHEADQVLIVIIGIILLVGLAMLSSASSVLAYERFGDSYFYFKKHLFNIGLGFILFLLLTQIRYTVWKKWAFPALLASIVLLILVFIPGLKTDYGTAGRWINIFGFSFQTSELVKLLFLIYLACWIEKRHEILNSIYTGIIPFLAILVVIAGLLVLQPDIGTLIIISASALIVYFVGGGKLTHLIVVGLLGMIAMFGVYQTKSYIQERVQCMLDPKLNTQEECYQINQSLIAVGSGGLWGRGIGDSKQKFLFLPEVTGDSIFPIIAEEVGFIWSLTLVLLYFFLFYRGAKIAKRAPDKFGQLLAVGIVSWIMIQAIFNIGGMINIMPMTGIPLPLISYGGSAMITVLMALGILVNISKYTEKKC